MFDVREIHVNNATVGVITRAQPALSANSGCVGVQFVPARTDEQFHDRLVSLDAHDILYYCVFTTCITSFTHCNCLAPHLDTRCTYQRRGITNDVNRYTFRNRLYFN